MVSLNPFHWQITLPLSCSLSLTLPTHLFTLVFIYDLCTWRGEQKVNLMRFWMKEFFPGQDRQKRLGLSDSLSVGSSPKRSCIHLHLPSFFTFIPTQSYSQTASRSRWQWRRVIVQDCIWLKLGSLYIMQKKWILHRFKLQTRFQFLVSDFLYETIDFDISSFHSKFNTCKYTACIWIGICNPDETKQNPSHLFSMTNQ